MNENQLLALLANEIDDMDTDKDLKALVYNRLSQQEVEQLKLETNHNPSLGSMLDAFTPLENDTLTDIEHNIVSTFFEDTPQAKIASDVTNKETHGYNLIEYVSKLKDKLKSFTSLSIAASALASFALIFISINSTQQHTLPAYSIEVGGYNKQYRNDNKVNTEKNPSLENKPTLETNSSGFERLAFFPENRPSILLRPKHAVTGEVDVFILLEYKNEMTRVKSHITKADSGSFKVKPELNGVFVNQGSYPSTLVVVIAKQGHSPKLETIAGKINQQVESYYSEDWLYLTQPIVIHAK
ncbi:hypothetical protein [Aliikangiella coralliicola]|uniref:Uncharacterized protein n=1 Tax=Aliikangiella coralliicola TaxID=2592383 RepID=A0A545UEN1_9GAMM|nr:hypothetical protein [Aliikangiella coralliicola]TQV87939.1 hypothetical protein FLL46_11210 [Aliikangiella coralliicola]